MQLRGEPRNLLRAEPSRQPRRRALYGCLAGATVAAWAVAAHGLAGGGLPGSTELTLLLLAAAAVGALAGALPVASGVSGNARLLAVLAGGELAGHEALAGMAGHHHESARAAGGSLAEVHLPGGWMLLAHTFATLVCAVLIGAADRLYAMVSRAVRAAVSCPRPLWPGCRATRWPREISHFYRYLRSGAPGSRAPPMPV
jgi:hypothetical protein